MSLLKNKRAAAWIAAILGLGLLPVLPIWVHGSPLLLIFGLLVSIPLIAWSSQLVLKVIDRFPLVIYGGGGLLGYVAGEMLVSEAVFKALLEQIPLLEKGVPVFCALLVVAVGKWLSSQKTQSNQIVDLLDEKVSAIRHDAS